MKLTIFLLFFYVACIAQPSQRCPVCPPSLTGVTNGWVLTDSSGHAVWKAVSSSGGSVTSVSGLNPLFTTSNPTTTPTFVLSNASAHTFFGDSTGSAGSPSYVHLSTGDLPIGIPNANLANSTISGVSLGASLFSHTAGVGLSGSTYNGGTSITWTVDSSTVPTKSFVQNNYLVASEGKYLPKDSLTSSGLTVVHDSIKWSKVGTVVTLTGIIYLTQTVIGPLIDTFQITLPVGTILGISPFNSGTISPAPNVGAQLTGSGLIYGNVSKKLTFAIAVFATVTSAQLMFVATYSTQ